MRDGDVVRGSPDIPLGIVENQVIDVYEFASDPHTGSGVMEVRSHDEAWSDWTAPHNLIEACQLILGVSDRRKGSPEANRRFHKPLVYIDKLSYIEASTTFTSMIGETFFAYFIYGTKRPS